MPEENSCRKAQIVLRACREMGLCAAWEASQTSESQYVSVWSDSVQHQMLSVRFSDHVLPDSHKYKDGQWNYDENTFEVALTCGHEEVFGDCYQAIEWVAKSFDRTMPAWVPKKAPIAA